MSLFEYSENRKKSNRKIGPTFSLTEIRDITPFYQVVLLTYLLRRQGFFSFNNNQTAYLRRTIPIPMSILYIKRDIERHLETIVKIGPFFTCQFGLVCNILLKTTLVSFYKSICVKHFRRKKWPDFVLLPD